MRVHGKTVLITGANGGLGQALLEAFLLAGAGRVYAACREPGALVVSDPRVIALRLDVTDSLQIEQAHGAVKDLDILVNNAGFNGQQRALYATDPAAAAQEMAVNYFGTLGLMRAFASNLAARQGAMINVLSILARVAIPAMGSLCASKAAALRITEAAAAELAGQVHVMAVLPGVINTAMSRGFPGDKASPEAVAGAIIEGLQQGVVELYPDPMAQAVQEGLRADRGTMQADFARYT